MKFKDITEEMNALYERKNHDYGNSFSETFRKLGIIRLHPRIPLALAVGVCQT